MLCLASVEYLFVLGVPGFREKTDVLFLPFVLANLVILEYLLPPDNLDV